MVIRIKVQIKNVKHCTKNLLNWESNGKPVYCPIKEARQIMTRKFLVRYFYYASISVYLWSNFSHKQTVRAIDIVNYYHLLYLF